MCPTYRKVALSCAAILAAYISGFVPWAGAQEARPQPGGAGPTAAPASAAEFEEQAEAAILKKLQQPAEFSFQATPLREAMDSLAQKHGLAIVINESALKDVDAAGEVKLSGAAKGISLEFGLNRLLGQTKLAWVVRHEVLEITSKEDADTHLVTRVYPVADLVVPVLPPGTDPKAPPPEPDYESLMQVIKNVVRPDSWKDAGGPGTIEPVVLTLVVSQTQAIQRQVVELLAALRTAEKLADPKLATRQSVIKCYDGRSEERVAEILGHRVTLDLDNASLADIAAAWPKQFGLDVALDHRSLQEANVDAAKTTFGLHAKERSLRSALDLVLREHKLSWIVQDGALVITSRDKMQTTLTVRVYPIADLIGPVAEVMAPPDGSRPPFRDPLATVVGGTDADEMMNTIKNTVQPDSWKAAGGPGTLKFSEDASALVCSQSREVHERMEQLLADLRERGTRPKPGAKANATAAQQPPRDDEIVLRAYVLSADVAIRAKVADEAAKLVRELVAPDSWTAKDTPAFLRVWPDRLVIRQTAKVHRDVQKLLLDLELLLPTGPSQPPPAPPKDD